MKDIDYFIRAGKLIIEPEFYPKWKECVEMFYAGSEQGKDLELAIDILKHLKESGIENTYDWLSARSPWIYNGTAVGIIAECSNIGKEFKDVYLQRQGIAMSPFISAQEHRYEDMSECKTLDDVVNKLINYETNGVHVQTSFNGTPMFSSTVTIDGAYCAITGTTKAEYEAVIGNAMNQMSYCKAIGEKIVSKELVDEWNQYVEHNFMYSNGVSATAATDILQAIAEGMNWEEIKEMFDDRGYSGEYARMYTKSACGEVEYFTGIDGISNYLLNNGREPKVDIEQKGPIIGE